MSRAITSGLSLFGPPVVPPLAGWESALSGLTHGALYAFLLVQPLLGLLAVWASGPLKLPFVGLQIPSPMTPDHALHAKPAPFVDRKTNASTFTFSGGDAGGPGFGIDTWANGKKGNGLAGTWVDAEDGTLGRNPIEQGSVDCTVGFNLVPVAPGGPCAVTHWVCMGARLSEVTVRAQL